MASVLELARSNSALILQNNEVMALANVSIRSLISKVGARGPAPAVSATPQEVPLFPLLQSLAVKEVEAKKGESEESDDMGFGLFHYASSTDLKRSCMYPFLLEHCCGHMNKLRLTYRIMKYVAQSPPLPQPTDQSSTAYLPCS
ncbi:60S acidic ribosomal protein P1-like [Puma concolor]|uniref:60S acidic ribosomal protein P1-like n=1 Tax=Puma concolor TaxID=9696 RepID=A0A6P6HNK2_PUMCO|nr:60S acidic ribosomal protein P1-like [Puma concolor]